MIKKSQKQFSRLKFENNQPRVLEVIFRGPNVNAVDKPTHADIPAIWPVIDKDPEARAVKVRGEGKAFSAGGDFGVIDKQIEDFEFGIQIMRESKQLFYNIVNCSKPITPPSKAPRSERNLRWP